jgi:AcrR family transcriptional regulator
MARKIPTNVKNKLLVLKKRQQIFEAEVKLFSKKGYHRTTLGEISKESSITLGYLYNYIITKEDTLHSIQEKATQAVMKAISTFGLNGEKKRFPNGLLSARPYL